MLETRSLAADGGVAMKRPMTGTAASKPSIEVTLHVLRGKSTRKSRTMAGSTLLIGSDPSCDVQMRSIEVAPRHCLINRRGSVVTARRFDPAFPVLVNGESGEEIELSDGDTLTIGPFELSVTIERTTTGDDLAGESEPQTAASAAIEPAISTADATPRRQAPPSPTAKTPKADEDLLAGDKWGQNQEATKPSVPRAENAQQIEKMLAGLQQSQSSRLVDIEKRERDLRQKLENIEKREQTLNQQSQRLEVERQDLDRDLKRNAQEQGSISLFETRLTEREQSLKAAELDVEKRRLLVTEEQIELDRRKQSLDARQSRFRRIRKRSIQRLRDQHAATKRLLEGVEERAAVLEETSRDVQRKAEHLKKVGDELSRRQDEIAGNATELTAARDALARDTRELSAMQTKVSQDAANIRIKERTLESFKDDLENRKRLLAEEESRIRLAAKAITEQEEHAQKRSQEAQRLIEDAEAKRRIIEKQEIHLRSVAKENDERRRALLEREQEIVQRAALIEEKDAALRLEQEQLKQRSEGVNVRAIELSDEARRLGRLKLELEQIAEKNIIDRQLLERRGKDIDAQAESASRALEEERNEIARRRAELAESLSSLDRERESFDRYKDQQLGRVCEVREATVESAEQQSILNARRKQIDRVEQEIAYQQQQLLDQGKSLAEANRKNQEHEQQIHGLFSQTEAQTEAIRAESERLRQLAQTLEQRQDDLVKRERTWCEEVKRRRLDLEQFAEKLDARQAQLERQDQAYRRNVEKLREVGLKIVERRRELSGLDASHAAERTSDQRVPDMRKTEPPVSKQPAVISEKIAPANTKAAEPQEKTAPATVPFPTRTAASEKKPALMPVEPKPVAVQMNPPKIAESGRLQVVEKSASTVSVKNTTAPIQPSVPKAAPPAIKIAATTVPSAERDADGLKVIRLIHQGAMATTHLVELPAYPEPIVLRRLAENCCRDKSLGQTYAMAFDAAQSFRHPHVATQHEFWNQGGRYGVVMEHIGGLSLAEIKTTVSPALLIQLCRQTIDVIAAAQKHGLTHRNLRPSRIILTKSGNAKILGYGEPAWLTRIHRCERPHATTPFVAPEDKNAHSIVDFRVDLFAVGRIFQRAASGPAAGKAPASTTLPAGFPIGFGALLARLTDEDPTRRCKSIGDVVRELENMVKDPILNGDNPAEAAAKLFTGRGIAGVTFQRAAA